MIEELPTFQTITPQAAAKIQQGQQIESLRLREVDQIPASWQAAQIHYRAQQYGALQPGTTARCPCCNEKVDVQPFSFSDGTENPLMRSDIILFFSFIRTLIIYLVIHLLVSDLYNLSAIMAGHACSNRFSRCPKTFTAMMAITNKLHIKDPLHTLDILNLVLIVVSILYFAFIRRSEYEKFDFYENEMQTEDDYAVFVTGVPILLYDEERNKMVYSQELRQMFTATIQNWLQQNRNGSIDPTYLSYVQAAQRYGHDPSNPPRIVTHIDLCWNLTELNNYLRNKEDLKDKIEQNVKAGYLNMNENKFQQQQTVQRLGVASLVNTQYEDAMLGVDEGLIDLCTKYDFDRSFNFCVSRFIGKAFVSFEYQHFLQVIINHGKKGSPQPLTIRGEPLGIHRAGHPTDIYWENLHYTPEELSNRRSNTFWVTVGSLIFAFAFIVLISWLRKKMFSRERRRGLNDAQIETWMGIAIVIVVSMFVSLANWALHIIIHALVGFESHETSVDQQRAYVVKTLLAQFINTALSYCIISLLIDHNIWSRSGILVQVGILFIFTAVVQIITNIIYLPSVKRLWTLSNYNRGAPIPRYQDRFNREYALPEFDLGGRFAYFLLQLFLISFFSYVIPLCVPLTLLVFIVHYYLDRINLFSRSSMNEHFGLGALRTMYKLMESSILVFALGNAFWSGFFHIPVSRPLNIIAISIAVFYVAWIWLVPFASEVKVICYRPRFEMLSYDECFRSNRFEQTYRIMNPATNLFHQGRMNYAFDQATKVAAATGYGQTQISGIPGLGGVPQGPGMRISGGGIGGVGVGAPINPMNSSGYYPGQAVPGVNVSGLRNFA